MDVVRCSKVNLSVRVLGGIGNLLLSVSVVVARFRWKPYFQLLLEMITKLENSVDSGVLNILTCGNIVSLEPS